MAEQRHSDMGASAAHRVMRCPGAVKLAQKAPKRTSVHAATGTAAHWVNAQCLAYGGSPKDFIGQSVQVDGYSIEVTEHMARACGVFVDYIRTNTDPADKLLIEQSFCLNKIDERLWGTADAVIWKPAKKALYVVDYKHGSGIVVDEKGNTQLRYYALGALLERGYPAETVRVVIVQPNVDRDESYVSIRHEEFETVDLLDFSAELREMVRRVDETPDTYNPGPHCQFCPGESICPALRDKAQEIAAVDFSPDQYTPVQLAESLEWIPLVERWVKAVREHAIAELTAGRPVPGYKLVDKRGTRVWANHQDAVKDMGKAGLAHEEIYELKPRSPAQIEKAVGKKSFKQLEKHVVMHSTGVTLAPESDKRSAVDSITKDFPKG